MDFDFNKKIQYKDSKIEFKTEPEINAKTSKVETVLDGTINQIKKLSEEGDTNLINEDDSDLIGYLTVDEAADLATVSKHTIRSWSQKKLIKSIKVRGKFGLETRISKTDLLNHMAILGNIKKIEKNQNVEKPIPIAQQAENNTPPPEIENEAYSEVLLVDYIQMLKDALESANKQLKEKDTQISMLLEKLTQANTLALNAQNIALNAQEEKKLLNVQILSLQNKTSRKKFLGIF